MNELQKLAKKKIQNPSLVLDIDEKDEGAFILIYNRLRMSMSQKDLADLSGISQSTISKIENGVIMPTAFTLSMLAKTMGKKLSIEFQDVQ
ncbi:MAG: helix-turn-helix transcriptional regulator [Erysipelotrichaceae bacterium]|nr:helix-turn-helix transcriptional regulator [Erysipelotrichaceae bacterium]